MQFNTWKSFYHIEEIACCILTVSLNLGIFQHLGRKHVQHSHLKIFHFQIQTQLIFTELLLPTLVDNFLNIIIIWKYSSSKILKVTCSILSPECFWPSIPYYHCPSSAQRSSSVLQLRLFVFPSQSINISHLAVIHLQTKTCDAFT